MSADVQLSVVVPVFNEERILDTAVRALVSRLAAQPWTHEVLLVENGSVDATWPLAQELAAALAGVRALHLGAPNYGAALRTGIMTARGTYVVCDEIDLGDVGFYVRAVELLRAGVDMVVGSKRHRDSFDERPWLRRTGTAVINGLLRLGVGYRGTDTHGLKAFRRERLLPVVGECVIEHNLFASELVIRAERAGLDVREIPLRLHEIRPPSVGLMRRVPRALADLARLTYHVRSGR